MTPHVPWWAILCGMLLTGFGMVIAVTFAIAAGGAVWQGLSARELASFVGISVLGAWVGASAFYLVDHHTKAAS